MPTQINLADQQNPDLVSIQLMRPITTAAAFRAVEANSTILPPPPPLTFSRAEWTLMVSSGLFYALSTGSGWLDWDDATAFRAEGVTEKDHLLVVASLLLNNHAFGHGLPWPLALAHAGDAIMRIAERAAHYREQEGITTPIDPGPMPRAAYFHEGRLWLSNHDLRLPDPSYQSTLVEHAVEATHVDVLIELAKQGEEATFKDLARTLGVAADRVDALWTGTTRRLGKIG